MAVTNYYTANGEITGEKTVGGARTDYLTDALGSVFATANQSAQVVNTYRYKPYGAQLAKTGAGADPAFRWEGNVGYRQTGKKWSDVYVRARHYSSAMGQWIQRDPAHKGSELHVAYLYANANPSCQLDPSGLLSCKVCGKPRLRTTGLIADMDREITLPKYSALANVTRNYILQGSTQFGVMVWETSWTTAGLQDIATIRLSNPYLKPKYIAPYYAFFVDWDINFGDCVMYFKETGWYRYDPNLPNLRPYPAVDRRVDTGWLPKYGTPDTTVAKLVTPNNDCTHRLILLDAPGDVAYTEPLNPIGLAHGITVEVSEQALELRHLVDGQVVPGSRIRDRIYVRATRKAELSGHVDPLP